MTIAEADGDLYKLFSSPDEELLIIGATLLSVGEYSIKEKELFYSIYIDTTTPSGTTWFDAMRNGQLEKYSASISLMDGIHGQIMESLYDGARTS